MYQNIMKLLIHPSIYLFFFEDVDDEASIVAAKMEVENYLGQSGLNLLFNNAGMKAGLTFATINSEDMLQAYKTNVVGPCLMAKVTFSSLFNFKKIWLDKVFI